MEVRRQIDVDKGTREKIEKVFNTTSVSVWRALSFRDNSPKSQRIRKYAELNGGVIMILSPSVETIHDADGYMRQYFAGDVMIEADKNTGGVALMLRGETVKQWENVLLKDLKDIQMEAERLR